MEGRAVAVSETFTLPAQPTTGTVTYIPLGGDGYTAPSFAYAVTDAQLTGAAGGGNATITCIMDDRFCSLVQYVCAEAEQVSSLDADLRLILAGGLTPEVVDQGLITAISATVAARTIGRTWNPPPIVFPGGGFPAGTTKPRVIAKFLNVADDEYFMNTWVFCFNIRVRELTPMGPLLWARGAT